MRRFKSIPQYAIGQIIRVRYPFKKEWYEILVSEVRVTRSKAFCWRPGARFKTDFFDLPEETGIADSEGEMILSVKGIYQPPGYRERIFYTKNWIGPDGERIGNNRLKVISKAEFTKLCNGYRYKYRIGDEQTEQ